MDYFISKQYGKVALLETWARSDGVLFGAFQCLTYRIRVNLPMSEVTPF